MKNIPVNSNGKMPHKKKESQFTEKPLAEVQADHELFLQAFEKPTQIYRYLRTRNILSPVFLHRSLYYMKNRMSRNHKNRPTFKIDSLIDKLEKNELQSNHSGSFLNLSFIGFFDKSVEGEGDLAHLEVHVVKMCHKKRKEASAPQTQVCVGSHDVSLNPPAAFGFSQNQLPPCTQHSSHDTAMTNGAVTEPLVTIPTHTFGATNGHQVKSYLLLFKVDLIHDQENVCEPASKRRRLSRGSGDSAVNGTDSSVSCYRAELVVYDRHGRCQLTPGLYDLVLHPMPGRTPCSPSSGLKVLGGSPRKSASWETAEDLKVETENLSNYQSSHPTLQFRLAWTQESGSLVSGSMIHNNINNIDNNSLGALLKPVIRPKQPLSVILANGIGTKPKPQGVCSPEAPQLVLYQFVYNNNGRQQTEARRDFHCPWCSINCLALYCLLKHLKLCHARFTFTYVPHPKGARIDVALNDCYDGSYAGNPQDLVWLSGGGGGTLFSRAGPARRAPTTSLIVCRPRRSKPSLSEFLEQDHADFDLPRSYILGHNRLYHHTMSCRPIGAHELDEDSEGEHDSAWMRSKTVSMIDDFSDVNDGEKEIMKLWNVHVMRHNFVGDCQITKACALFVEAHGEEVLRRNLYRNYVLHLVSLHDFGVIGAGAMYTNIRQLQAMLKERPQVKMEVMEHWGRQRLVAPKAFSSPRSTTKTTSSAARSSSAAKALFMSSTLSAGRSSSMVSNTTKSLSSTSVSSVVSKDGGDVVAAGLSSKLSGAGFSSSTNTVSSLANGSTTATPRSNSNCTKSVHSSIYKAPISSQSTNLTNSITGAKNCTQKGNSQPTSSKSASCVTSASSSSSGTLSSSSGKVASSANQLPKNEGTTKNVITPKLSNVNSKSHTVNTKVLNNSGKHSPCGALKAGVTVAKTLPCSNTATKSSSSVTKMSSNVSNSSNKGVTSTSPSVTKAVASSSSVTKANIGQSSNKTNPISSATKTAASAGASLHRAGSVGAPKTTMASPMSKTVSASSKSVVALSSSATKSSSPSLRTHTAGATITGSPDAGSRQQSVSRAKSVSGRNSCSRSSL